MEVWGWMIGEESLPLKAEWSAFYTKDPPRSIRETRTAASTWSTVLIGGSCSTFVFGPTIGPGDSALVVLFVVWSRYPWTVAKDNLWQGRTSHAVASRGSQAVRTAESPAQASLGTLRWGFTCFWPALKGASSIFIIDLIIYSFGSVEFVLFKESSFFNKVSV